MRPYLNGTSVPLSVAVYLATDNYDYNPDAISATALLKPVRQNILAKRVPDEDAVIDISSLTKSRGGTAIHDAIERAWLTNHENAMRALGYPEQVITRTVVNPDPAELEPDTIPVYLEKRGTREIDGVTVSGKFDIVVDGQVEDFKTTSVWGYQSGNKDEDYQLQGSIYRWLHPELITEDTMAIRFILTDWAGARAMTDNAYPNTPIQSREIPLLSLEETENFIRQKLNTYRQYQDVEEAQLPLCTDKDLWRPAPTYKYYKKSQAQQKRATKNFDNLGAAHLYMQENGNVGEVVEIKGKAIACKWCSAFPLCSQKDQLLASGDLEF